MDTRLAFWPCEGMLAVSKIESEGRQVTGAEPEMAQYPIPRRSWNRSTRKEGWLRRMGLPSVVGGGAGGGSWFVTSRMLGFGSALVVRCGAGSGVAGFAAATSLLGAGDAAVVLVVPVVLVGVGVGLAAAVAFLDEEVSDLLEAVVVFLLEGAGVDSFFAVADSLAGLSLLADSLLADSLVPDSLEAGVSVEVLVEAVFEFFEEGVDVGSFFSEVTIAGPLEAIGGSVLFFEPVVGVSTTGAGLGVVGAAVTTLGSGSGLRSGSRVVVRSPPAPGGGKCVAGALPGL